MKSYNVPTVGYDIINNDPEYMYLRRMPMDSVCEENVEKLLKEKGDKETELTTVKNTSVEKMWLNELNILSKEFCKYQNDRIVRNKGIGAKIKKKKKKKKKTQLSFIALNDEQVLVINLLN